MNNDLISRSVLLEQKPEYLNPNHIDTNKALYAKGWNACNSEFYSIINTVPIVDAEPVRHGRWEHLGPVFKGGVDWYRCGVCGQSESGIYAHRPYCSVCGAKMDGELDENN